MNKEDKTDKIDEIDEMFDRVQLNMAEFLDREVYIPVINEIGDEIQHSFGFRKENFKNYVEEEMNILKDLIKIKLKYK